MKKYTLELGFNWDAALFGTTVSLIIPTLEPSEYRPLQLGLTYQNPKDKIWHSAPYQFDSLDGINFKVFNLGTNEVSLTSLAIVLARPETGQIIETPVFDPQLPTPRTPETQFMSRPLDSHAFGFGGETYQGWVLPHDMSYQIRDSRQDITLELSVAVEVTDGNETRWFLGDPEMWIQAGG